jgi:chemotaxis protein MotB
VAEQQGGTKVVFIKKKNKGHGHHGGAWKVAYADFVTAMMALFIVLWLLTQSDQASKEEIAEYFRTGTMPGGSLTLGRPAGSNPPVPVDILPQGSSGGLTKRQLQKVKGSIEKMLKRAAKDPGVAKIAKNVVIKVSERGALIELVDNDEDLLFSVASSDLKPAVVRFLEQLAPTLAETGAQIEINGHTDARGYKDSKKSNWDLSFERAERARKVLEGSGVEHGKIVGVIAHADTQPYVEDDPLASQNRRLSILVTRGSLPEFKEMKPGEEGAAGEEDAGVKEEEAEEGKGATVLEPGSLKREAERQKRELERQQKRHERREKDKAR